MAIDYAPGIYQLSTNLLHPSPSSKLFYPMDIPVSHWQLRHYISYPEKDLLYYASGKVIYCLNTSSKRRTTVATLPFEARCTASAHGWICVGGEEDSNFAAIKLDEAHAAGASSAARMGVDDALPVDSWRDQPPPQQARSGRAARVSVERIGQEIVNSISIHRISDEEAHLDDIIAVLTNNDRTVHIYSLPAGRETTILDFPDPVNHATLSPDGRTLIVVGDLPKAFFYRRQLKATPPQIPKPHNRLTSENLEWKRVHVAKLYSPGPRGPAGYFTTAWSGTGRLVAVGGECGFITVFDMRILDDRNCEAVEDAIVAVVPSSRPDAIAPFPGAIRSMVFSPGPWDLLIWAEDQGTVGIGDLRTGLRTRQHVTLEPRDECLTKVMYEDAGDGGNPAPPVSAPAPPSRSPAVAGGGPTPPSAAETRYIDDVEEDFLNHIRSVRVPSNLNSTAAISHAVEYIQIRRREREVRQEMGNLPTQTRQPRTVRIEAQGLTPSEQMILDSLRMARQREEARDGTAQARSINYTSADMFSLANTERRGSPTALRPDAAGGGDGGSPNAAAGEITSLVSDLPRLSRTNALSDGVPRPTSSHGSNGAATSLLPALSSLQGGVWQSGRGQSGGVTILRQNDGSRLPRRSTSIIISPPRSETAASGTNGVERPGDQTTNANGGDGGGGSRIAAPSAEEDENPWHTIEQHMSLARGPLFGSSSTLAHPGSAGRSSGYNNPHRGATDDFLTQLDIQMSDITRHIARVEGEILLLLNREGRSGPSSAENSNAFPADTTSAGNPSSHRAAPANPILDLTSQLETYRERALALATARDRHLAITRYNPSNAVPGFRPTGASAAETTSDNGPATGGSASSSSSSSTGPTTIADSTGLGRAPTTAPRTSTTTNTTTNQDDDNNNNAGGPRRRQQAWDTLRRSQIVRSGADQTARRGYVHDHGTMVLIGPRTAGLAISPDGRVVWAACEEGIFELRLNLKERLYYASVEMR